MKKIILFFVFIGLLGAAQAQGVATSKSGERELPYDSETKAAWIAAYPEAYKTLLSESAASTNSHAEVSTDELAKNEQKHISEKNKWVAANPEEYRKMGGNPEEVLNTLQPKYVNGLEKIITALPISTPIKEYILIGYEAVSADNQKPTTEQIAAQTASLKKIFFVDKTKLQIGYNNQIRLYDASQNDLRAIEKRLADNRVEWFFENKECQQCSKILHLRIEKEDDTTITYIFEDEDEVSLFAYRLSFSRTKQ